MGYSKEVQSYQDHLRGLAFRYSITMTQTTGGDRQLHQAYANPMDRCVDLPEVTTDCGYAVALHEFGHLLAVGGWHMDQKRLCYCPAHICDITLEDIHAQIGREEAAWEWARENALDWTVGMEQTCQITLRSYTDQIDKWPDTQRRQKMAAAAAGNDNHLLELVTGMKIDEIMAKADADRAAGKTFDEFVAELLKDGGEK